MMTRAQSFTAVAMLITHSIVDSIAFENFDGIHDIYAARGGGRMFVGIPLGFMQCVYDGGSKS